MKFKILAGAHREGGVTYRKGQVVDSRSDLARRFGKEKFQRVGTKDTPPVPQEEEEEPVVEEETPVAPQRQTTVPTPSGADKLKSKWEEEDAPADETKSEEEQPAKAAKAKRTRKSANAA